MFSAVLLLLFCLFGRRLRQGLKVAAPLLILLLLLLLQRHRRRRDY